MNNKVKLIKLIINGFRGARKEIWLNFEDDSKSLVLFGNNGDGKSSISDAIEWFFTDGIDYLQREGCGRDDYFNIYMPPEDDATVEIGFNDKLLDSKKTLKRKGGHSFSNTSDKFKDYMECTSGDSFILRHHTMREFIDKTKKEKLERVEEIIGFGIVKEIRDNLLKAWNALRDDKQLAGLQGQLDERKRDLISVIGKDEFQDADILNYAGQLAKQCDSTLSIVNEYDFKTAVETLGNKIKASDRGKELSRLDSIDENTPKLIEIGEFLRGIAAILAKHNELAKREETIKASVIEKLYIAAIEAIESKLVDPGKCPICKKPLDTELLLKLLTTEIEEIKKVLKERGQVIQNTKSLSSKIPSCQTSMSVLLEDEVKTNFLTDGASKRLTDIATLLAQYEGILIKIQESPKDIPFPPFSVDLQDLEKDAKEIQQGVAQRRKELSQTDEEKNFYQNVQKLQKLYDDFIRYNHINRSIGIYTKQIESLGKIYQDFESMERASVQKVLETISSDVNDLFTFLHPDDNFDEVELIPTEGRGVEFKLKYHGQEISPPMKILSEAHLNSLGICLFFASAKHFNKVNGFLVLDDVVTSFDTGHRRPLARLMSEKFPDTQFLLFTHDDLWFEMLKKDLPSGKWFFKELMKWTKDNGLDFKDSPIALKERVRNSLNSNDIQGAANKCRVLIEEILKEKCENLGVRGLEFRTGSENDRREASELINALTSYLKDNETLRDPQSKKLFNQLRASQLITNIGSHHQNLNSTTLSRGDIETILRDIEEFESLFVCSECKKEPNIKYSPRNSRLKQCECGKLKI